MKLRRLGAYVEQGQPARLLAGALGAVERGRGHAPGAPVAAVGADWTIGREST